ncbi:MAG TPA: hypothetical protein VFW83_03195 [Bryobacteraceae bacterium]|nr:hypothetical protein [Bryobacteraceae bacterium]
MRRMIGLGLLLLGASGFAFAGFAPAPEIDPNTAVGAVTLLWGGIVVLQARRRAR